jgi:cytochrome c
LRLLLALLAALTLAPASSIQAQIRSGGRNPDAVPIWQRVVGGDASRGQAVIARYGCGVCHLIPGIRGARGTVGPSLERFGERNVIAGEVPNTPAWLVRWLENPPAIAPRTMMPATALSERELRDAAAFLMTLRD